MRDNQTTRRMPMIVTAMACATASMLAGLALAPSAMAADTTITLQGADGASLAGHTFDVYRIGTYTDQILNGTRISSLGVRGDTASNAWAADAIGIANAYDPDTADDIAKVYGYDDAGNIANIKMDSQTRQLRNISKALGQSTRKPAAIQGGANLTTTRSTLTINVPAEGLYYITDSAGNPIMVGTKSGNANIMKNDAKDPQWRTLGTAVVKSKSMRVDKKVQVQRNGATVGKDGTASDPVGVTVGDTVTNTVEVTVPNKQAASAVKFKLIDQPKGQTYVKGSLSVRLKNAPQTDITADAVIYDGTTQNNAKSIPGDPTLKTADNRPADPDLAIPAGHLAGTSLPIGGKNTRAVITGHSNLKGATLFTRLGELEDGDPFYIKVMGNTLAYRVTSKRIVSPTDTKSLRVHKGKDEVTLLTCTGQGNTLRLLVTGERNSMPDQAPLPGDATGDVKKAAFVSGVTVTGILAVGFSLCRSRRAVGHHIGLPQTHDSDNLR